MLSADTPKIKLLLSCLVMIRLKDNDLKTPQNRTFEKGTFQMKGPVEKGRK